jgi:alpha-tubulin suppressor-like RCC1 family protein
VSAGDSYTLAVKTDGHLSGWGDGQCGQLDGVGGTATNWLSASAGTYGSSALRTDGTLWMWGSVCPDDEVPKLPPTQVGAGTNWRSVSTA